MGSSATVIEVRKRASMRYGSLLHRSDGVQVALEGGSYNRIAGAPGRLPHDIAHFVVEDLYGLRRGLWGVLAAGGIVQNASFVGGRLPPHALRRAKALTDSLGEDLRQAEVLVRATADLTFVPEPRTAAKLGAASGERWSSTAITSDAVEAACTELGRLARAWHALSPGEAVTLTWRDGERSPSRRRNR